jgi:alkylhydroperoxidase/carboxymuconolactone decarboxylase family protein YurZ
VSDHEHKLQRLALNEEAAAASLLGTPLDPEQLPGLDAKTCALVRLGAVVVLGAPPVTYQWAAQAALDVGASDDEIVGTLLAVTPMPGLTRAVSAAPEFAVALGYDVDEAVERPAPPSRDA